MICPHCKKCSCCGRGSAAVTYPPYYPQPTVLPWWGVVPPYTNPYYVPTVWVGEGLTQCGTVTITTAQVAEETNT